MEVVAVTLQQTGSQTSAALSMIKKDAQTERTIVNMIAQSAASGSRGQNLDITV